jgi:thiol-disulfide isomerase/thioredoxin
MSQEINSLDSAAQWLNSEPLTGGELRGKVVLVQFWTYTCINWIRTLPYIRAWFERYEDLVVIGVHTPEFSFEHDLANVGQAMAAMRVEYPVAIDNHYAVWRGFDNHYWPALYLVDEAGEIRNRHFGEGAYEETELALQELLGDAGRELATVDGDGVEAAADWSTLESPENYLGSQRTENFTRTQNGLSLNHWALTGEGTLEEEATIVNEPGSGIAYRFHARDLHLVMGPAERGASVAFRVLLDGQPPGADHGVDVDHDGSGTLSEQRLYQLVRQRGAVRDRTFEITFLQPGVEAYAFTFG